MSDVSSTTRGLSVSGEVYRASTTPWMEYDDTPDFQWNQVDLPIPNLPPALNGLRILHLSDLHFRRRWQPSHDELVRRLDAKPADLILFTGDWVDDKINQREDAPLVRRLAEHLIAPLGCFSVLGNHDGDLFASHVTDTNIQLIDSGYRRLSIGDATLDLIGLPGVHRDDLTTELLASYPPKPAGSLRIFLSHFPDYVRRVAPLGPDLFLAGHTHGGQICLPGGIPIIRHDSLPRRYCKGIHRIDRGLLHTWLVVSRGFGFAGNLPVRLFCPAEVMVLTLRYAPV